MAALPGLASAKLPAAALSSGDGARGFAALVRCLCLSSYMSSSWSVAARACLVIIDWFNSTFTVFLLFSEIQLFEQILCNSAIRKARRFGGVQNSYL